MGNVIDPNTPEDSNLRAGFADNNITKNGVKNPPSIVSLPAGFPANVDQLSLPAERVDQAFFDRTKADALIGKSIQAEYGISQIPVRLDDMEIVGGRLTKPCRLYSGWANARKLDAFIENGCRPVSEGEDEIAFYLNRNGCIRYRKSRESARNILSVLRNLGTTERSRTYLRKMGVDFDYPKPVELIRYLFEIGAFPDDAIVMDTFAGSGTTGEAILSMNAADGAKRRFIMVEMDQENSEKRTAVRLSKIIEGYSFSEASGKKVDVAPLGGGFRYCRLGTPLFNEFGDIDSTVSFPDLAAHIFFAETGVPILSKVDGTSPYLGKYGDKAVYLLFAPGQEATPREAMGNVLTPDALAKLSAPPEGFEGSRVVYAEGCTVSPERLKSEGVEFKQIPYQIEGA